MSSSRGEARFRALLEASSHGVWVLDRAFGFAEPSPGWCAFTGQAEARSQGQGWREAIHPEDRAHAEAEFAKAAQARAPFSLQLRLRRPDGSHTLSGIEAVPVFDGERTLVEWVLARTDLSTQELLRRSEERLRLATEDARVAVWEYDFLAGSMTRTDNHDALYGISKLPTWTYDVFIKATHPDDRELSDRMVQASVAPGGPDDYAFDFRVIWPDGSVHWLAVSGHVAAREPGGTATLVRGALIDVTRLKEIEAELRGAVRARDEFLQIAGHELRTPLTPLSLRLATLLREVRANPELNGNAPRAVEQLEGTLRQVARLTELVDGLLDVSRISQGRLSLELTQVELSAVVRECANQFATQAERAKCAVELGLEPGLVGRWDRARLEQVISNLLTNAFKYGAGHPVRVMTERVGQHARLTVRDGGIGIPPEALGRIFGKFERAVSERHYGGLGLGLFIARQIVEALGGSITVASKLGEGSTFAVELPLEGRDRPSPG